jgi:glycosyltransferase involved in cell wall biosynthesis
MRIVNSNKIKVLMVTGVYFPEVNGAILQCMRIVNTLKNKVLFSVLTSTSDYKKVSTNMVNNTKVTRILLGSSKFSLMLHAIKTTLFFLKNRNNFDIVHLHGYSLRSVVIIFWAKIFNKKIIIKMTSVGHDDPEFIYKRGRAPYYFYLLSDVYIGISPAFYKIYSTMGLSRDKYHEIPNGINTMEFVPVNNNKEKSSIRLKLGLPKDINLILFVGHFSSRKSPDHLLKAWLKLLDSSTPKTGIVFIGRTDRGNFEIDDGIIDFVKLSTEKYLDKLIFFRENIYPIDEYYKACDVFVLSSSSEGLPNALLEAMSCALPVISTRLEGITDWIIEHKFNGLMYDYGDVDALYLLLESILQDTKLREYLGFNARKTVCKEFAIANTANKIHDLYNDLLEIN